jgi:hypothetical protein
MPYIKKVAGGYTIHRDNDIPLLINRKQTAAIISYSEARMIYKNFLVRPSLNAYWSNTLGFWLY